MGRFKFGLKSLNCDGRSGAALLAVCAVLLLLAVPGPPVAAALRYERAAIMDGEVWRLVTGHLVHLGFTHALLNAAGLALMWMLFAREYRLAQWLLIVSASIAAIDTGLWSFNPDVEWYVGASGVLHGVLAAGALSRIRHHAREGWVLATFLLLKLTYEQLAGAMPFSAQLGSVIVDSHLYGAAGGGLAGALLAIIAASHRREGS